MTGMSEPAFSADDAGMCDLLSGLSDTRSAREYAAAQQMSFTAHIRHRGKLKCRSAVHHCRHWCVVAALARCKGRLLEKKDEISGQWI